MWTESIDVLDPYEATVEIVEREMMNKETHIHCSDSSIKKPNLMKKIALLIKGVI